MNNFRLVNKSNANHAVYVSQFNLGRTSVKAPSYYVFKNVCFCNVSNATVAI